MRSAGLDRQDSRRDQPRRVLVPRRSGGVALRVRRRDCPAGPCDVIRQALAIAVGIAVGGVAYDELRKAYKRLSYYVETEREVGRRLAKLKSEYDHGRHVG